MVDFKSKLKNIKVEKNPNKEEHKEVEKMFVAFGQCSIAILFVKGIAVEAEMDGDCNAFVEMLMESIGEKDPDQGLWVWEGVPLARHNESLEYGREYDGLEFSGGKWREPTLTELACLTMKKNPWKVLEDEDDAD